MTALTLIIVAALVALPAIMKAAQLVIDLLVRLVVAGFVRPAPLSISLRSGARTRLRPSPGWQACTKTRRS
jgi:hypothetical protein